MVDYKVLKYELEYFRNPKKAVTERELHIIVQPKYLINYAVCTKESV